MKASQDGNLKVSMLGLKTLDEVFYKISDSLNENHINSLVQMLISGINSTNANYRDMSDSIYSKIIQLT